MKRYRLTWENNSINGSFPLFAEFSSVHDVFDCLLAMDENAKNIHFVDDELMYKLGLMYSGDLTEFDGEGFIVAVVSER